MHNFQQMREARLSRSCNLILRYLKEKRGLHSANDIYFGLRSELMQKAPGLTTVYRSLETLLKSEFVQEIKLGDGEKNFEFVEDGQHHHHLICTNCRESVHLHNCFVEQWRDKIKNLHGFEIRSHVLELFGLCPKCQINAPSSLN